jgi:DNA polymerase-1
MPDWIQMEYKLMLDYAASLIGEMTPLVKKVLNGEDVHQATADLVTALGSPLTRSRAKNGNFATLYGSGLDTLAATLKCGREEARVVKESIFRASPEIRGFIRQVMRTAEIRGYIFNWLGRRSYFPDPRFAYRAPNYLIQGGCADIMKVAMNRVDEYLLNKRSKMLLSIHDELLIEVHEKELFVCEEITQIMETVYPSRYLPLTASAEWSETSMGAKSKGFPGEARNHPAPNPSPAYSLS